ncbi:hypothetical protein CHH28_02695 [Bacterioplanes sanyensis]|uniref:Uncharacterized protein n=1 Tax=Bacterioplanes sanyensis TaxID=1249553 RepID=A0A222FEY4_9GAMM|nr:hypothetical protein CHH28_02695 [Bacterioplanes sanyensis]
MWKNLMPLIFITLNFSIWLLFAAVVLDLACRPSVFLSVFSTVVFALIYGVAKREKDKHD